ncbi:MAG: caspase family protein [Cyclobacteriaceae bacterium]|nr:caspase family protein [Cyclobacteriaceae bacterium]
MKNIVAVLACLCIVTHSKSQQLETIIQKGHELAVVSIAISPDSNFVVTGSKDKSAKLWDLRSGREVRSFLGHEHTINALDISADGKLLITGSYDKTTRIWDLLTGKELYNIPNPDNGVVTDVAFDPKGRFFVVAANSTSGYGDTARVYDYKTRRVVAKIRINPDKGLGRGIDIAMSPDGNWIALGEDNRVAQVYQTNDWRLVHKFEIPEGFCGGCATKVVFSPDSKFIYTAAHRGQVKKHDVATGNLIKVYEEDTENTLTALAISADGKWLARATEKDVRIWEESTGKELIQLAAERQADFHSVAFSLDSRNLLVTCDNNTAFAWDIDQNKKIQELTGLLNQRDKGGLTYDPNFYWQSAIARYVRFKNHLMITKDGKQLIKGKFGTRVKRWDIASGQQVMEYSGHAKAVLSYDLSKDGRFMLTGGGDGKVILWDVQTGDSIRTFKPHREPIFSIKFSNDETMFACSSWDATMRVYDLNLGKTVQYWDFQNNSVYNLAFHPNDLYLFTAQLDNSLQMVELDTKSSVRSFIGHTNVISSIQVSADEKSLLSTSWDGSIRLWDIATGLMLKKFIDHRGAVHIATLSNDGKLIYSAGADRAIRVWDIATGKLLRKLEGHNAEVTSLLFSPDNKMLISHSLDGVSKFWDLSSSKEFFEHIHLGERDWMVKNPEGYFSGTQNARQYIHFVSGMTTYSVNQFFDEFYRPDLLPKLFQTRGSSGGSSGIQGKLKTSPPPGVKLATLPSSDPTKIEVYVKLTDNGGGVENLRLFHNGKNIAINRAELKMPSGKDASTTYKQIINLVGGQNSFTAIVSNKSRVDSEPASAEVTSDVLTKNSKCYILAVGINQYKNPRLNLNYAKPDAESFIKVLDEKSKNLFGDIELHALYDDEASRQNILKALEDLSQKIHAEDVFIFYYAGHGSMVDNRFFLIPTESLRLYDLAALQKEALEASVLQEKFKSIKALKQLIVMDACQSGGSVELLANRGAAEEKAIAQLSRSAGIHVMASAGSEQFATEFAELGHGLFTYVLIQALSGEADGAPRDGKVTIYELKSYIDDQVPEMTRKLKGKPQYPYTFSRGQDFPIILEEK